MLIKDRLLKLINKKENYQESETLVFVGGGVELSYSAAFGRCCRVEKFRSLGVEKEGGVNVLGWAVSSPLPLWERARVRGPIQTTYSVILSPIAIQGRRIFKTIQKGDSSGFRPQNDGTPVSLVSPRPLGRGLGRGAKSFGLAGVTASFMSLRAQRSNPVDCRENQRFSRSDRGKYLDWSDISPLLSGERTQLYLSGAKVTDAGEGSISPKRRCA